MPCSFGAGRCALLLLLCAAASALLPERGAYSDGSSQARWPWAVATLCANEEAVRGASVLGLSLFGLPGQYDPAVCAENDAGKHSPGRGCYDGVALVTERVSGSSVSLLESCGWRVKVVPAIQNPYVDVEAARSNAGMWQRMMQWVGPSLSQELHEEKGRRWSIFTKLHAFRLEEYELVLYVDADAMAMRPLTHVFNAPVGEIVPVWSNDTQEASWVVHGGALLGAMAWSPSPNTNVWTMNAGVMLFRPSEALFEDVMSFAEELGSNANQGDQGRYLFWGCQCGRLLGSVPPQSLLELRARYPERRLSRAERKKLSSVDTYDDAPFVAYAMIWEERNVVQAVSRYIGPSRARYGDALRLVEMSHCIALDVKWNMPAFYSPELRDTGSVIHFVDVYYKPWNWRTWTIGGPYDEWNRLSRRVDELGLHESAAENQRAAVVFGASLLVEAVSLGAGYLVVTVLRRWMVIAAAQLLLRPVLGVVRIFWIALDLYVSYCAMNKGTPLPSPLVCLFVAISWNYQHVSYTIHLPYVSTAALFAWYHLPFRLAPHIGWFLFSQVTMHLTIALLTPYMVLLVLIQYPSNAKSSSTGCLGRCMRPCRRLLQARSDIVLFGAWIGAAMVMVAVTVLISTSIIRDVCSTMRCSAALDNARASLTIIALVLCGIPLHLLCAHCRRYGRHYVPSGR